MYHIGIQEIDVQHSRFIDITNEIIDIANSEGEVSKGVLESVLNSLAEYSIFHFDTEEAFFARCQYKDADAHIAVHRDYNRKAKQYVDRLKDTEDDDLRTLVDEMTIFAGGWILDHILEEDMKYVEDLRACGIGGDTGR